MKYSVFILFFIAVLTISCDREEPERQRYITGAIVGSWWTKTSTDSITHEYSNYGKLSVKEYSGNVLRYSGEFDYDIIDDATMEYWGERLDATTPFEIYNNDTLQLNNFNGRSYLLFRIN